MQAMITIRPASTTDAATVFTMIRAIAEEQGDGEDFTATLEDVLRDGFGEAPLYEALVAEIHGQAVGLASFFATYSTFKGQPCLYLDNLYVAPTARQQGVARALLVQVARIAQQRGCQRVDLHVKAGIPAERVYQRVGFSDSGNAALSLSGDALEELADLPSTLL